MKLDSRIIKGKRPLTCFFEKFESLTDYCIGTLTAIMDLGDRVFDVDQQCKEFRYCLPCEWVKSEEPEKKYRPYTLAEWVDQHEIGEVIHYRDKDYKQQFHVMYSGYIIDEGEDIQDGSQHIF